MTMSVTRNDLKCYLNLSDVHSTGTNTVGLMADPEILKGAGDNVSAPLSSVSNTHNELYDFYMRKDGLLKNLRPIGEGPPRPPLESAIE